MTETVKFVDGVNYTEADQADFNMNLRPQGILPESSLGILNWSAIGGLFIRVTPGAAFIRGFLYKNDANKDIAVGANASGSTRVDTLVVRVNPSANTAVAQLVVGTPGAGAPVLTQVVGGTWDYPIADISVANGAGTILAGNITDRRVMSLWPVSTLDALISVLAGLPRIRAMAYTDTSANIQTGSYNIASCTRLATGQFRFVFATAMPNANYIVNVTPGAGAAAYCPQASKTTTQFDINIPGPTDVWLNVTVWY